MTIGSKDYDKCINKIAFAFHGYVNKFNSDAWDDRMEPENIN